MQRLLRTADNTIWGACRMTVENTRTLVNKVVKGIMDDEVKFDAAWRAALDQFIVEEELPDAFRDFLEWYGIGSSGRVGFNSEPRH